MKRSLALLLFILLVVSVSAALAQDAGLGRTQAVDAASNGLKSRRGGIGHPLLNSLLRRLNRDQPALAALDLDVVSAGAEDEVADRLDELPQLAHGAVHVLGPRHADLHGVTGDRRR